jgi:hypothetical protein
MHRRECIAHRREMNATVLAQVALRFAALATSIGTRRDERCGAVTQFVMPA